jgi:uncharacterized damage-inducible protein DinB
MRIDDVRLLYAYHYWATQRILDAAARVSSAQFTVVGIGGCCIRDTLLHTLQAESLWRGRWQGLAPGSVSLPDDFPTVDAARARWQAAAQQMTAFLDTLDDTSLDRTVTYTRKNGTPDAGILWHLMLTTITHGTQHRSEVAMALTELGQSPGDLDFIVFVAETQPDR